MPASCPVSGPECPYGPGRPDKCESTFSLSYPDVGTGLLTTYPVPVRLDPSAACSRAGLGESPQHSRRCRPVYLSPCLSSDRHRAATAGYSEPWQPLNTVISSPFNPRPAERRVPSRGVPRTPVVCGGGLRSSPLCRSSTPLARWGDNGSLLERTILATDACGGDGCSADVALPARRAAFGPGAGRGRFLDDARARNARGSASIALVTRLAVRWARPSLPSSPPAPPSLAALRVDPPLRACRTRQGWCRVSTGVELEGPVWRVRSLREAGHANTEGRRCWREWNRYRYRSGLLMVCLCSLQCFCHGQCTVAGVERCSVVG